MKQQSLIPQRWLFAKGMSEGIQKRHISSQELLEISMRLGDLVYESAFRPTWILVLWRGGAPIGMCVQEYLKHRGIKSDHIAIRTSSYTGVNEQSREVRVHGLEYVVKHANADDRLLLVDDIFDSGRTVEAVLAKLREKMRLNVPRSIRIATAFYKPKNNKTALVPDYFVEATDEWVVFPHELEGLSLEEIRASKGPVVAKLLEHE